MQRVTSKSGSFDNVEIVKLLRFTYVWRASLWWCRVFLIFFYSIFFCFKHRMKVLFALRIKSYAFPNGRLKLCHDLLLLLLHLLLLSMKDVKNTMLKARIKAFDSKEKSAEDSLDTTTDDVEISKVRMSILNPE